MNKILKYSISVASSAVLLGCLSSIPTHLLVSFQGESIKQLMHGIPKTAMQVYYISAADAQKLSYFYKDRLLVSNYAKRGNLQEFDALLARIYSVGLKSAYSSFVRQLISDLPLESAHRQYQESLEHAIKELDNAQDLLQMENDKSAALMSMLEPIDAKIQALREKKLRLLDRKNAIQQDVAHRYNSDILSGNFDADIPYVPASFLANYRYATPDSISCNRFKSFDYVIKSGKICYMFNAPHESLIGSDSFEHHISIFSEFIKIERDLYVGSSVIRGTLQDEYRLLVNERRALTRKGAKEYGSAHEIAGAVRKIESSIKRYQFIVDRHIMDKNAYIIEYLGDSYIELQLYLENSVALKDPSSPFFADVMSTLDNIKSSQIDSTHKADFDSTALMTLLQVDALDRDLFPVFTRPSIIEQASLSQYSEFPLILSQDNMEFVSQDGVVPTLVDLIGGGFVGWQNGLHEN